MWLSECCSEEPHPMFEMDGDAYIGFIGICSKCRDNTGFKEYDDDRSDV